MEDEADSHDYRRAEKKFVRIHSDLHYYRRLINTIHIRIRELRAPYYRDDDTATEVTRLELVAKAYIDQCDGIYPEYIRIVIDYRKEQQRMTEHDLPYRSYMISDHN